MLAPVHAPTTYATVCGFQEAALLLMKASRPFSFFVKAVLILLQERRPRHLFSSSNGRDNHHARELNLKVTVYGVTCLRSSSNCIQNASRLFKAADVFVGALPETFLYLAAFDFEIDRSLLPADSVYLVEPSSVYLIEPSHEH
eukprot:2698824-Pleurochrysis_carterae.AAC.1